MSKNQANNARHSTARLSISKALSLWYQNTLKHLTAQMVEDLDSRQAAWTLSPAGSLNLTKACGRGGEKGRRDPGSSYTVSQAIIFCLLHFQKCLQMDKYSQKNQGSLLLQRTA